MERGWLTGARGSGRGGRTATHQQQKSSLDPLLRDKESFLPEGMLAGFTALYSNRRA